MTSMAQQKTPVGGYDLSVTEFQKIAQILKEQAGITLAEGGHQLVVSRLTKHLDRLGLPDFTSYIQLVTSAAGEDEIARMVDALTTNTTRFFREAEHFDLLENLAMPDLIRRARAGGRVRIWSAACSSGEEPYSIAATVLKGFPDAARFDVKILATDISHTVLRKAEAGVYEKRLADDLSPDMRRHMFEAGDNDQRIKIRDALRELITFRYLNFVEPWPVSGPFDAIFCRNAAIYMDEQTQNRLWSGLERVLGPDGLLFIGHSERIGPGLADRLTLFATTAFRRPQGAAPIERKLC